MQTRQPTTLAVSITFFVIASIFVALRFVSRIFVVRRIALHDYLMLLAWVRWNLSSAGDGPCTSSGRAAPDGLAHVENFLIFDMARDTL
jgi:hypothetical protein